MDSLSLQRSVSCFSSGLCIIALLSIGCEHVPDDFSSELSEEDLVTSDYSGDEDISDVNKPTAVGLTSPTRLIPVKFVSNIKEWENEQSYLIALEHLHISKTDSRYGWRSI